MASPFPGMDPYLEGELWQEFHETLAGEIRAQLIPQLPEKYVALLAKRYVLALPARAGQRGPVLSIVDWPTQRTIYPDVHVVAPPSPKLREPSVEYAAGVTLVEPAVELASPLPEEIPLLGLPAVPVPPLSPDPDIILDVQAAANACFALVRYERLLDYASPPPLPPLDAADSTWIARCLQAAGPA